MIERWSEAVTLNKIQIKDNKCDAFNVFNAFIFFDQFIYIDVAAQSGYMKQTLAPITAELCLYSFS